MNRIFLLSPAILGALVVLQAGMNRKIALEWGFPFAVFLNGLILTLIAAVYFWISQNQGTSSMTFSTFFSTAKFWYFIPGIFGFLLVFGGPFFISKWGATHTFVLLISAQLLVSTLWDWKGEGNPITLSQGAGVALTWLGVVLVLNGR